MEGSTSIFLCHVVNFPLLPPSPFLMFLPFLLFLLFIYGSVMPKTNPESHVSVLNYSVVSLVRWAHFNVCVGEIFHSQNERKEGRRRERVKGGRRNKKEEEDKKARVLWVFCILFSFF